MIIFHRTGESYYLLCIEQHILKNSQLWKTVFVARIDYKKADDMVPQIWIIENLKMLTVSDKS